MQDKIQIYAPASVSNLGCGFDILGFPFNGTGDRITIERREEEGIRIHMKGPYPLSEDPKENVAGIVAQAYMQYSGIFTGLEITIHKGIKPGSGIGSSAATSAGVAVGLNYMFQHLLTDAELVKVAMEGEGHASGSLHADNVAPVVMGGLVLIRSYQPLDIIRIPVPDNLWCVVLHPEVEVKTSEARKILKPEIPLSDAVRQWGNVAGLIAGFFQNDYNLIGRSVEDHIIEPVRKKLIPGFDQLKEAAIKTGALGCTISGSGPSVFALCQGKEKAYEVETAMAEAYESINIPYEQFVSQVSNQGARVIQ